MSGNPWITFYTVHFVTFYETKIDVLEVLKFCLKPLSEFYSFKPVRIAVRQIQMPLYEKSGIF